MTKKTETKNKMKKKPNNQKTYKRIVAITCQGNHINWRCMICNTCSTTFGLVLSKMKNIYIYCGTKVI